jgi:hypothetical protein
MGFDYHARTGDRDDLVATLRQLAADRGERDGERAAEAQHAADALEGGADGVYFDRVLYVVGPSDRYSVIGGSRGEIEEQLTEWLDDAAHQGRPGLATQAHRALERVREGVEVVRVGHLVYVVRV